nr:mucin-2-like [Misgurnus anguillicaudatus]XP_055060711.1 mucin-2-like [Misgurnus anguillicaudatus]
MEWRIIFAVLCLFAASYVTAQNQSAINASASNATASNATALNATASNATAPNATAPNATAPNATSPNATAPNATAPNATAPNATAPNATAPNATAPNATAPNATAPNATAPNATAANATAPNATASANSTTPVELKLSFSIADTFKDVYTDMSAPETVTLINSITSQIEPVYKKRFSKFLRMVIKKFRSGSIVVDSALQFDSNSTTPNATDVKQVLTDAAASGNLSIKISNDTINVTAPATPATPNVTTPNVTANTTTNGTSPNVTVAANSTTPVELNLSFSIADTFKDTYADLSAPDTVNLIKSITSQIEPVYKKRFPKFLRMLIKKFRSGSIVVDSALQFDSNGTTPNVTDVKQVLTDAAASGNLTIKISNDTINVTAPATPATPNVTTPNVTANTTTNGTSPNVTVSANSTTPLEFNISFSIADTFKAVYSDLTAPETVTLIKNITTQIEPVYTKRFPKFLRMVIKKFSNGSILTDAALQFDSNGTIPNVTDVKQVLIDALANGNVTIKINNDTINVTAPATVTPVTPTNATNTTSNTALFTLVFSILENFNDTLSNLTSSDAITLQSKITNQFGNVFKKRHTNYLRMLIRKFSKGSIVTNSSLEFNSTGGTVAAQQVVDTIIEGIKNGNFTFTIDQKSIKVTDSSGFTASSSSRVITSMLTVLLMSLASLLLSGVIRL